MYDPNYGCTSPSYALAGSYGQYPAQPGFEQYAQAGFAQPGYEQYAPQPGYEQYAPPGFVQPGYGQPAYAQPGFAQPYDPYGQPQAGEDPVDVFLEELGIQPEEVMYFCWIAEYGLQPDALPPSWTSQVDPASGRVYYVDSASGSSSWESPIAESLRTVIAKGRDYLRIGGDSFLQDQKQLLWEQRRRELDGWHGPYTDDEGRSYYVNSESGTSSWQDPRDEAQFLMQLEGTLLDALPQTLPAPEVSDLPGFGFSLERAQPDSPSCVSCWPDSLAQGFSPGSPTSGDTELGSPSGGRGGARTPRANRAALLLQVARGRSDKAGRIEDNDPTGVKSAYKKMAKTMNDLDYICKDEAEAQHLLITRDFKKRRERKRKKEKEEYEAMYGEAWRRSLAAMEVATREEEARKKALADAAEQRKSAQFQKRQEEERKAEAQRLKEEEQRMKDQEARQKVLAEKAARLEAERQAEEERQNKERRKREREELLQRLKDVCTSHNVEAMRQTIKDGEDAGLTAEVAAVRQAMEEELGRRKAVALKARHAAEKLAGEFKSAKEAQDFGGAILAAQWRAAVKEVSKPLVEE